MFGTDFRMAMRALSSNKWRSLLTMLGVIIGIVSVVTTVSLGEGVKQQVAGHINELDTNLITVLPGRLVGRDDSGNINRVNIFNLFGGRGVLSERDWQIIQKSEGVEAAVPMSLVPGVPSMDSTEYEEGVVIATTEDVGQILGEKLQFGDFFSADDINPNTAVIGKRVAEELFKESVPVGKSFRLRGQTFLVRGVLEELESSPFSFSTNYNSTIFVEYEVGKRLSDNQTQIYQILAKPAASIETDSLIETIRRNMLAVRGGQADFTVLRQRDNLALANNVLNLLTGLIASIASISLIVGGIGIMNIMLVSVSERTREIGVRKAIGATNSQIYSQFMIEAAVLSVLGGILGVIFSILANYGLRIFSDLQPVITLPIVLVATAVAVVVGIVFGVTPALKAAHKDPIQALRHE